MTFQRIMHSLILPFFVLLVFALQCDFVVSADNLKIKLRKGDMTFDSYGRPFDMVCEKFDDCGEIDWNGNVKITFKTPEKIERLCTMFVYNVINSYGNTTGVYFQVKNKSERKDFRKILKVSNKVYHFDGTYNIGFACSGFIQRCCKISQKNVGIKVF